MALRGGLGQREGSRLSESVRRERASECVSVRRSEGCEPPPVQVKAPIVDHFIHSQHN